MDGIKHQLHSAFKSTAEMIMPVLSASAFREKGVLTPEEFVKAGDMLVQSCPTWCWAAGDAAHTKAFLPAGKQYLLTRNVPCMQRAAAVGLHVTEELLAGVSGEEFGDDWVGPNVESASAGSGAPLELPTISGEGIELRGGTEDEEKVCAGEGDKGTAGSDNEIPDIDDIPDINDLDIGDEEDDEACAHHALQSQLFNACEQAVVVGGALESDGGEEGIIRTRTYDLSITYDKYYQTPRFWLVGYNEAKQPLSPAKILEDVSEEHARKTITVDPHPNNPALRAASIHPCRHAEVMKKLVDMLSAGEGQEITVDQYLVLFLKFIASVVPTIEYDYTLSVGGK